MRVNGTEVAATVGGIAPTNGEWHHVAVVYDGTRAATNQVTRNVHFYVDGIQRGAGNVLQNLVVASNAAPLVVGNSSPSRTAANLLAGNIDDVLVIPGWAPSAVGNGNESEDIRCFMESSDDIFPPGLSVPADIVLEAAPCLVPAEVALGDATAWDDCAVASVTNDAPELFPVGTTAVTWTATDTAGNTTVRIQTVTVEPSHTGDCDGDGLTDYAEVHEWGTNPLLENSDSDGVDDATELADGTDPNAADSDDDGLLDGEEKQLGTFPDNPDSDGDGLIDGWEVFNRLDPLDDGSGDAANGPDGDPDHDGFPNSLEQELGGRAGDAAWSGEQLAYRLCHRQSGANASGLYVEVEDAANCGGANDERQIATDVLNVPDLMAWGFFLDITVSGTVEDQNAGYDKVSITAFTNTFYFEGNEHHNGCAMAAKSATCRVLVLANSPVTLRYDTVGHMFHRGAHAEITAATVAGSIKSVPVFGEFLNDWRQDLGVGEEMDLEIQPDSGGVIWKKAGSNTPIAHSARCRFAVRETAGNEEITVSFLGHEVSRTFHVVEPTGVVHVEIDSVDHYDVGIAAAGMMLYPVVIGQYAQLRTMKARTGKLHAVVGWAMAFPVLVLGADGSMGGMGGGGRYRPELDGPGAKPNPLYVKWSKHFLLAGDMERPETSSEEMAQRLQKTETAFDACESEASGTGEWRRLYMDAAAWRYPRNGQLDVAIGYFQKKSAWTQRILGKPEWMHDAEILEAAAEILSEIGEWSFPRGMLWFEAKPGQGVLRAAGVERPDDLPDEASKAAWRKAVEEDARRRALLKLQDVLALARRDIAKAAWWHCKQAMVAAEKEKDEQSLARLKAVKARILASVEADYRLFLLYDGFADMPDIPSPPQGAEDVP